MTSQTPAQATPFRTRATGKAREDTLTNKSSHYLKSVTVRPISVAYATKWAKILENIFTGKNGRWQFTPPKLFSPLHQLGDFDTFSPE